MDYKKSFMKKIITIIILMIVIIFAGWFYWKLLFYFTVMAIAAGFAKKFLTKGNAFKTWRR